MRGFVRMLPIVIGLWAGHAVAHEVRPGYLEIQETSAGVYSVLWKVPARGDYRLGMYVRMPDNCEGAPTSGTLVGAAFVERWQARCPGGLTGRPIMIDGLAATRTDVLVRLQRADGTTQTERLTPDTASFTVRAVPSPMHVARTYFALGVEHILLGIDHLLFVLGLLFLVKGWKPLVATVTAFTVAHSMTLAVATLGYLHVAQAPVEATIALSVMFVASEILHGDRGRDGLAKRAPWAVAVVFGLLHGLGFAGALRDVGLPERDVPLALLFFNVGVEAGQLLFIAACVAILVAATWRPGPGRFRSRRTWHTDTRVRVPLAYVVGSTAAFWLVERVVAFAP